MEGLFLVVFHNDVFERGGCENIHCHAVCIAIGLPVGKVLAIVVNGAERLPRMAVCPKSRFRISWLEPNLVGKLKKADADQFVWVLLLVCDASAELPVRCTLVVAIEATTANLCKQNGFLILVISQVHIARTRGFCILVQIDLVDIALWCQEEAFVEIFCIDLVQTCQQGIPKPEAGVITSIFSKIHWMSDDDLSVATKGAGFDLDKGFGKVDAVLCREVVDLWFVADDDAFYSGVVIRLVLIGKGLDQRGDQLFPLGKALVWPDKVVGDRDQDLNAQLLASVQKAQMVISGFPIVQTQEADAHVGKRLQVIARMLVIVWTTAAASGRGVGIAPNGGHGSISDVTSEEDASVVGSGRVIARWKGLVAHAIEVGHSGVFLEF